MRPEDCSRSTMSSLCGCTGAQVSLSPVLVNDDKCMAEKPSWGTDYNCGNVESWCTDDKWKADVLECCPCTCDPDLCDLEYIYDPFNFDQFPLQSSMGFYKSVMFQTDNVVEHLAELKYALTKTPTPGYCEVLIDNMTAFANSVICKGGTDYNVGYYYSMVLPVYYEGAQYSFSSVSDFDFGAVVMIDGLTVHSSSEATLPDMEDKGALNYTVNLKEGNHLLQVFGAGNTETNVTSWSFSVDVDLKDNN